MRHILNFLTVVAIALSATTACSKKDQPPDNVSLIGKWKLISSTSPYIARISTPPIGSVLSLGADGRYEIIAQSGVKDTGTFVLSTDALARPDILYFNYQEYFQYGLEGKSAFTANIHGDVLELAFLTNLEFVVTPVIRFKKL